MRTRDWRTSLAVLAALSLTLIASITTATDVRLSGFGTVGYARSSESDSRYLRYIDEGGTFKTDSLVGVQAEAQFNSQWSATVQAVASAPRNRDDGAEAKIRWAFVSFRMDNDWLFRAGRVRPPFLFESQNAEVGVTHDYARLPVEVYSASPIYDIDGIAVTKNWAVGDTEIALDAFWGRTNSALRVFERDINQSNFLLGRVKAKGLILSYGMAGIALRGGFHQASGEYTQGRQPIETILPNTTFLPVPPPLGGTLYLPHNPLPKAGTDFVTLGANFHLGKWRATTEYVQRLSAPPRSKLGLIDKGTSFTIARSFEKWTPYVTYARLLSDTGSREIYQTVNSTPVPLLAQGAPLLLSSNFHRSLVDQATLVYDQYSVMLGTSYGFSPTSKLKFEWMRTRVGLVSALVDGDMQNRSFNVLSASYSVVF